MRNNNNITDAEDFLSQSGVSKLSDLHTAYLAFENWPDFLLSRTNIKKGFEPRFRTETASIDKRRHIVSFDYSGGKVRFYYRTKSQLIDTFYTFAELFEREDYGDLKVKGRTVIDIGANVGDSAIYFALNGAGHIYAFEPFRFAYDTAIKNISLNGVKDKVTLLNAGCGGRDRTIKVDMSEQTSLSSRLAAADKGETIRVVSLDTIAQKYLPDEDAILKLDCEGAEYDIILSARKKTLRKFSQITIEYHFGYLNLKEKLERSGFATSHTMPRMMFNDRNIRIGLLRARRKDQDPQNGSMYLKLL